jgi:ArsR family metal-binding transcriptional regulator
MVLRGYRIAHILPCLADPDKIRAIVELDEEIQESFPYINSWLKGCIYNHPAMMLTLKKDGRMITLYPRKVTVAKAVDEKDVQATMEWLKNLIGEVFEKKDHIKPDYSRGVELKALDIFKLLPGINCKACDEPTCLAFAVKLLAEERSVVRCAPLFTPEHKEKRQFLLEILRAAGYPVPGIRE